MTSPYAITHEWFNEYREGQINYDYPNRPQWGEDCPIWRVLAPGEDFPYRRWADHQAVEASDNPYEPPVYACHPYHLDSEAMRDFLALERAGFTVKVTGYSEYHPTTIRVEIHPTLNHFSEGRPVDHFNENGTAVKFIDAA